MSATQRASGGANQRYDMTRAALILVAVAVLTAGCGAQAQWVSAAPSGAAAGGAASPSPEHAGAPQPVPGKVMLGAYLDLSGLDQAQSLALRRQQLGRDLRILHRYYRWTDTLPDNGNDVPADSILMLSWDGAAYATITNRSQDAMIAKDADALARYRRPVFLRWAWEMNGNWFVWGGAKNGNNPAGFITAWRHMHDIFVAHGATNVAWVWGPNAGSVPAQPWNEMGRYYPGDGYVDWVGLSGYFGNRETPEYLFGSVVRNYGTRKPIMIAETGALEKGGTVKSDWIDQLAAWITAHPAVGALVWFDTDNDKGTGKNWRIDSSPTALAAFRRLANDPRFTG
jgi:hypothetical protein